jgi:hypothetical protein
LREALLRSVLVFYTPVVVWEVTSPRTAWRVFESWRFANPEAVRPSAAGFAARRWLAVAIFALLVVAAF